MSLMSVCVSAIGVHISGPNCTKVGVCVRGGFDMSVRSWAGRFCSRTSITEVIKF